MRMAVLTSTPHKSSCTVPGLCGCVTVAPGPNGGLLVHVACKCHELAAALKERDEWKAEAYRLADVLPDGKP